MSLFPDEVSVTVGKHGTLGRKRLKKLPPPEGDGSDPSGGRRQTVLDRLHTAMLLQANGATAALKGFLAEEHGRGPDLERLANALTALYPRGTEERRLVEALALVFPR